MSADNPNNKKLPTLWDVTKSVLAALLGVQKNENYKRDFQHGRPYQYIIVGLVAVMVFILTIILVVRTVLSMVDV